MKDLEKAFHVGVLGNFAVDEKQNMRNPFPLIEEAPTGLVVTYVPFQDEHHPILSRFPLSHSKIAIPSIYDNLQVEPEVVLDCEVKYYHNNLLYIIPKRFTAYNDVTLHRFSTSSIVENKNWGRNSKGIAREWINIDSFDKDGNIANYNIVSFIKRDGAIEQYSIDTPINKYPYMYEQLLDWIIEEIKRDRELQSPNSINSLLKSAKYPNRFLINIGTTQFTAIGEKAFLEEGDEVFVVLYDRKLYRPDSIKAYLLAYKTRKVHYEGMVILHQTAYIPETR